MSLNHDERFITKQRCIEKIKCVQNNQRQRMKNALLGIYQTKCKD